MSNICVESGCRGACCINMFMYGAGRDFDIAFPSRVFVSPEEFALAQALVGLGKPGVRALVDDRGVEKEFLVVNGPCPNLSHEGGCTIYENRPPPCRGLLFNGPGCKSAKEDFDRT